MKVRVQGRPEFGQTSTHADGTFDFLINGGGPLELQFTKAPKFLESARRADVAWNGTTTLGDIVLLRPDRRVSRVRLGTQSSGYESAIGSQMTDAAGTRTGSLLVPPGAEALMLASDGSAHAMNSLNVRITEFTVGDQGPAAMPADIAYNTAYTYAFEVNADEAVSSGAPEILFSEPLPYYVHNFMEFPVGMLVPMGSYDRARGVWVPETDGIVLQIVSIASGLAELDLTGDGVAEAEPELERWGIAAAERAKLADLCSAGVYSEGHSLWRIPIPHFTRPWDANTGWAFPDDGIEVDTASVPKPVDPSLEDPCEVTNASTLDCETQVFHESIPLVGTPYSLHYSSERVPGRAGLYRVRGKISTGPLPPSLLRVTVDLEVGGRDISRVYPRTAAEQEYEVTWDGYDSFGRRLYGPQIAEVKVCYVYQGKRVGRSASSGGGGGGGEAASSPVFGRTGGSSLNIRLSSDPEVESCRSFSVSLGSGNTTTGLGEWGLNVHHQVSGRQGTILLGNGKSHHITSLAPVTAAVAGNLATAPYANGMDARLARMPLASSGARMVSAADGSVYYSDSIGRIRKVSTDGLLTVVAGGSNPSESGPAVEAVIGDVSGIDIASDGTFYFTELDRGRVRKVSPDGMISTVAGTLLTGTTSPLVVDGGRAIEQRLGSAHDVRIAPDGSLYIASGGIVTRVDADGYIVRIAGSGQTGFENATNGAEALGVRMDPRRLAFSPSGHLYILNSNTLQGGPGHRLYRLDGDKLVLVAGCEVAPCSQSIGNLATRFSLMSRQRNALAFDRSGTVHLIGDIDPGFNDDFQVLTIDAGGRVRRVFSGPPDHREGLTAAEANLDAHSLAFGPLGLLTYHRKLNSSEAQITALTRSPTRFGASVRLAPSESGDELYVFGDSGRHMETRDAYTGSAKYTFTYDESGWLTAIADVRATTPQVTTIERDAEGNPTAIVGPFGHRTTLRTNAAQQLVEVTDPLQRAFTMTYSPSGLLQSFTNPRQGTARMTYDSQGRIETDEDAAGAVMSLTRTELSQDSWQVVRSTDLGRTTTYVVDRADPNGEIRTNTFPDGTQSITTRTEARSSSMLPDDSMLTVLRYPDGRWGAAAPTRTTTWTLPSGLQRRVTETRSTTLVNALDPSIVQTVTDRLDVNGRLTRTEFSAATRVFTTTTAAGRVSRRTVDVFGRTSRLEFGGFTAVNLVYDARGRVDRIEQGPRVLDFGYGTAGGGNGLLATIVDPTLRTTTLQRDAAGRVESETFQGLLTEYTWDGLDNLTSVTPPGKPVHGMDYTPVNLMSAYEPPPVPGVTAPQTTYTYDSDRLIDTVTRPDGLLIDVTPDLAGRVSTVTAPTGTLTYEYYASSDSGPGVAAGKLESVSGPYGTTLSYAWNGPLMTAETTSGAGLSSVSMTANHNNDFIVTEQKLDAGGASSFLRYGYDADLLLTCLATTSCPGGTDALTLTRSPTSGFVTQLSQGETTESFTYNAYRELATQTSQLSGTPLFALTYDHTTAPRDGLGRITRKTAVRAGVTQVTAYTYNTQGRLHQVHVDGTLAESYTYDDNGNRLTGYEPNTATRTGVYDGQDRLLSYGPWTFTYTPNGELASKTDTTTGQLWTYTYDVAGNLLNVTLPDGRFIQYVTDGRHRRIAKKIDGVIVRRWVYQDQLNPIAELDGSGALLYRYAYGSMTHSPDFAVNASGETYRVIRDQLGSPLLVVNIHDEDDVLLEARYTAFGQRTVVDGDGAALTLGFAGGIYDEDTGLTRFGARDYDPVVGRWTAKDPILWGGGQGNLYVYVGAEPVNYVDPSGNIIVPILVGIAIGVGGEIASQVAFDGVRSIGDLDGSNIAVAAIFGAIGGASGFGLEKLAASYAMRLGLQALVGAQLGVMEVIAQEAVNSKQGQNPNGTTGLELLLAVGVGAGGEAVDPLSKAIKRSCE